MRSEEGGVFPGEQEVDEEFMLTPTVGTPAGLGLSVLSTVALIYL